MNGKNIQYYWDTCLFYAWLKNEDRPPEDMAGLDFILQENKQRKNVIFTSTITIAELLQGKIDEEAEARFQEALQRSNLVTIDVDPPIAEEARRIRDFYFNENGQTGKTVCTPDAIHLATAIIYRADEFHTFDGKDKKDCMGLTPLSGNVAGTNLTITKPIEREPQFDFEPRKDDQDEEQSSE